MLLPDECWCSCISLCRWDSCALDMECACSSLRRRTTWPSQSRRCGPFCRDATTFVRLRNSRVWRHDKSGSLSGRTPSGAESTDRNQMCNVLLLGKKNSHCNRCKFWEHDKFTWMAMRRTVFRENFRPQVSNKSSRLGPNNSMTSARWSSSRS